MDPKEPNKPSCPPCPPCNTADEAPEDETEQSTSSSQPSPDTTSADSSTGNSVAGTSSMPSSPNKHDKHDKAAANQSARSAHGHRERHGHPHNRAASNQSGACVNANHGSRSHSRNLHRDGHLHHHRERQRHTSASRERSEPSNVLRIHDREDDAEGEETLEGAVADLRLNHDESAVVSSASPSVGSPAGGAVVSGGNHGNHGNGPLVQNGSTSPPNHNSVHYNWQAGKTTLKERLAFMFNNEIMADVHFVVGKGGSTQRIPAHKFVLAIGSAVFDAMFNGGMATMSSDVELPDVEPAAFLALLKFLYSDEVHIGPETVMTTLYTAKKYAVPSLERSCVEFLKRNLSSDNAFMLLTQARLFDESQLAALCLESIDKNTSEALGAEGFTDVDLDTLCVVLERDTLGIRECKLFNAACKWSEAECIRENVPVSPVNKRQALSRGLQLIRFPLMTVEEFAMGAAQSGILTDREVVELFLHFTVNPKPSVNFQDTPRCCLTGKEQVVSRFCQIESRWGYSGTSDRIRFMVNRRIFVVGFGLYGSIHGPAEYTVNVQIIHTDSGKVCGQNDTTFQCDGTNSTFRVMFKEPVEIQPNTSFTACSTLKGPDSYYGTKGLRKVTHESVTSGKVTFQFTYAAGNNNGTSVEDGQLPEIIFYT